MVLGTLAAGEMVHMVEDLVAVVLTPEKGEQSGGSDGNGNDYFLNEGISVDGDVKLYGYMIGMQGMFSARTTILLGLNTPPSLTACSCSKVRRKLPSLSLTPRSLAEVQINRLASQV